MIFAPITLTTNLASNTIKLFSQGKKTDTITGEVVADTNDTPVVLGTEVEMGPLADLEDEAMSSLLSIELCMRLLTANKESLGRALVITYAVDNHRT